MSFLISGKIKLCDTYGKKVKIGGFTYLIFFLVVQQEKKKSQLYKDSAFMNDNFTPGGVKLAHTSGLRKNRDFPAASAIDAVVANKGSGAIPKVRQFIKNFDFKPERNSLDEDLATILYLNLTEHQFRFFHSNTNVRIQGLNWQLEKFKVILRSIKLFLSDIVFTLMGGYLNI